MTPDERLREIQRLEIRLIQLLGDARQVVGQLDEAIHKLADELRRMLEPTEK
jgi:hypothetical protein